MRRNPHRVAAVVCATGLAVWLTGPTAAARPSLGGTTGLFNVPTANIAPDGTIHVGYSLIDRKWSYEGRGTLDNRVYYVTAGFLPNLEASIRATVLPGESLLEDVPVDAVDRMGSARYRLIREGRWPALAVGIDDIKGTRRYHSFYVVGTKDFGFPDTRVGIEISAGYGFRSFDAARYLLDGEFGGANIHFGKSAFFVVEYDSEKWNGGLRLSPFDQLTAQLVFLDLEIPSGGVSWTQRF